MTSSLLTLWLVIHVIIGKTHLDLNKKETIFFRRNHLHIHFLKREYVSIMIQFSLNFISKVTIDNKSVLGHVLNRRRAMMTQFIDVSIFVTGSSMSARKRVTQGKLHVGANCLVTQCSQGYWFLQCGWHGNSFHIADPLWGESIGHRWVSCTNMPAMQNFHMFFVVGLNTLSSCRGFETLMLCHFDIMMPIIFDWFSESKCNDGTFLKK